MTTCLPEIDFSGAKRSQFHKVGAQLNLPVYLEQQVQATLAAPAALARAADRLPFRPHFILALWRPAVVGRVAQTLRVLVQVVRAVSYTVRDGPNHDQSLSPSDSHTELCCFNPRG